MYVHACIVYMCMYMHVLYMYMHVDGLTSKVELYGRVRHQYRLQQMERKKIRTIIGCSYQDNHPLHLGRETSYAENVK